MQPQSNQPDVNKLFQTSLLAWRANYQASKAANQDAQPADEAATPAVSRQPRLLRRRQGTRR